MVGTANQIAWAEQIKVRALQGIIRILENKRMEVMRNEQAGYFIHDWQELTDQVRRLILADPSYRAIKASSVRDA